MRLNMADIIKHFKRKTNKKNINEAQIETHEKLYRSFKICTVLIDMFLSEVDKRKYKTEIQTSTY